MKLVHRGVTLELEDDDWRVKKIEALLFGAPEAAPDVDEPVDWLKVETVDPWLALWRELQPLARTWLGSLLREGRVRVPDVKKHVKLGRRPLSGLHKHIGAVARRNGLRFFVEANGRGKERRYFLAEEAIAPLSKYAKN